MGSLKHLMVLQTLFPTAEVSVIIKAFRQEELFWKSFCDPDSFQMLFDFAERQVDLWTPAKMALISAGMQYQITSGVANGVNVDLSDSKHILPKYYNLVEKSTNNTWDLEITLIDAACLAIVILQKYILAGNWDTVMSDLSERGFFASYKALNSWRIVLAIVFGLLRDKEEIIDALIGVMKATPMVGIRLISYLVSCQPMTDQAKADILFTAASMLNDSARIVWLCDLQKNGEKNIVAILCSRFNVIYGNRRNITLELTGWDSNQEMAALAMKATDDAILKYLQGDLDNAVGSIRSAQKIIEKWSKGIQLIQAAIESKSGASSEQNSVDLNAIQNTELFLENQLLKSNFSDWDLICLEEHPEFNQFPFIKIRKAIWLDRAGRNEEALLNAKEAANQLCEILRSHEPIFETHFLPTWRPEQMIEDLVDLHLLQEASKCIDLMILDMPLNLDLYRIATHIYVNLGDLEKALVNCQTLTFLSPENAASHRYLAEIYEFLGDWENSFEERKSVVKLMNDQPGVEDWIHYANISLKVYQPGLAINACEAVLQEQPKHVKALYYSGLAYRDMNIYDKAITSMRNVVSIEPGSIDAWLELEKLLTRNNMANQVIPCLQEALLSNSDSYELNLEIARAYYERNNYQEAVNFAQKASMLRSELVEPIVILVKALIRLDQIDQAEVIVLDGLKKWKDHPELVKNLVKIDLQKGDYQTAINSLHPEAIKNDEELAILYLEGKQGDPENIIWNEVKEHNVAPDLNAPTLSSILERKPKNIMPYILQAELFLENRNFEEAFKYYQQAGEYIAGCDSRTKWRLQSGFGKSALKIGKIDIALVALQEALEITPDHILLLKDLTEAYQKADLIENAIATAQLAYSKEENNASFLAWYSHKMRDMNRITESIKSMKRAIRLDPVNTEYQIALTDLFIENKENYQAEVSLQKISKEVPSDTCRKIAQRYYRLRSIPATIDMYEKAISRDEKPSPKIFLELAYVYSHERQFDKALTTLNNSLLTVSNEVALIVAKAIILWQQERTPEAISFLEKTMKSSHIINTLADDFFENGDDRLSIEKFPKIYPGNPLASLFYYTSLLYDAHRQLDKAIVYATKASQILPDEGDFEYLLCSLRLGRNTDEDVRFVQQRLDSWLEKHDVSQSSSNVSFSLTEHLYCLRGEVSFYRGEMHPPFLSKQVPIGIKCHERYQAYYIGRRLFTGDYSEITIDGIEIDPLIPRIKELCEGKNEKEDKSYLSIDSIIRDHRYLWLAEAASVNFLWEEAEKLLSRYVEARPHEPRAHHLLLSYQINLVENQKRMARYGCLKRAPDETVVAKGSLYKTFENNIVRAKNTCNSITLKNIGNHGVAAFKPSIKGLSWQSDEENALEAAGKIAYYREHGNYQQIENLAEKYPHSPDVLLELGLTFVYAESHYPELASRLDEFPYHPICQIALAKLAEQRENYHLAYEKVLNALTIWKDEYRWHAIAAHLAKELGFTSESIMHWEAANQNYPGDLPSVLCLAEAYIDADRIEDAINWMNKFKGDKDEAYQYWYILALALFKKGDIGSSKACIINARRLISENRDVELLAAKILYADGETVAAVEALKGLYRKNKQDVQVIEELVDMYIKTNHAHDALIILDQTQVKKPTLGMQKTRVDLFHQLHGVIPAKILLKEILKDNPGNIELLTRLAHLQFESKEYRDAAQTSHDILMIDPENKDVHVLLGKIYNEDGQLDKAMDCYSQVIAKDPSDIRLYLDLAEIYKKRREEFKALELYREVIRISPDDSRAYYQAAMLMKACKDFDSAEVMLRKAAVLSPHDIHIHRQLSTIIAMNLLHSPQEATRRR